MKIFGENLKAIREQRGLTQKELSEILELSTNTIISYEQSQKKPSYDVLVSIAEKLNVSLDKLCGVEIKDTTIADIARKIVTIGEIENHSLKGQFSFENLLGDTTAIVFKGWIRDCQEDGLFYSDEQPQKEKDYDYDRDGYRDDMNPDDFMYRNKLGQFVGEYIKMRGLLQSESIDSELFQMWLDKAYSKLDY